MKIAVGTEKGAYQVDSTTGAIVGPSFPGWKVTAFGTTPSGDHLAAVGSNWFGAAIHRSSDWNDWHQIENGPTYGEERPLTQIWTLKTVGDRILAGVADAGLFSSTDDGETWEPFEGLNEHPTRDQWEPGFGGLCAHRILTSEDSIWVAISAVGVFRSDDGGDTWQPKNTGITSVTSAEDAPPPEVGYCVHNLDHDPANPNRIWRQDHAGVFRSYDGGDTWERIEQGLPAGFGFVMRRDHRTGRLFVLPLEADVNRIPVNGQFRAYASDDDGDSWHVSGDGWDPAPTFSTVLRGAVAADGQGTVVLGTTGGSIWLTENSGGSWSRLDPTFPRIGTVALL